MTRKRFPRALQVTSALVPALLAAAPAAAQSLDELQRQIETLQQQVDELKAADRKQAAESDIRLKWGPAPQISSADGRFSMKLRGRLFVDAAWMSDDDGAYDVDATEFRAARLGIEGKAWDNVKYKFEVDFSGNEVDLKDTLIGYDAGIVGIDVGYFKTFNSLDEQTSSRYATFMERASFTDAFALDRQTGIGLGFGGDNWTASFGAFKGGSDNASGDLGETYAARVTFGDVIKEMNAAYHIGASYRYRKTGADEGNFRYRQRAHQHLAPTRLVDTGAFADKDQLFGFELAGVYGPFSAQAEYAVLKADRANPDPAFDDPSFKGWYVDGSWFITGESRKYEADKGAFGRVRVNNPVTEGGFGAWQVAARYDVIDLSDENVFGGKQKTWIVGVNWHLNDYSRIMMNYSKSDISDAFNVAANGADGENDVDAFGIRFQVDW